MMVLGNWKCEVLFGGFVFSEKKEDLICIVADSLMSKVEGKSETLAPRLWVNLDPPSLS